MRVVHERHAHPTLLSDFILGSQDGLVNVLGILLGLVIATHDVRIIFIATLAAMAAETISMGAVAYTSTASRRRSYLAEEQRELDEMRTVPEIERDEVRAILRKWGYGPDEVEDLVHKIEAKPKAMLDLMMAFELGLAPVDEGAARRSFVVVGLATAVGSIIPLLPFFFLQTNLDLAAYVSVVLSAGMLFAVGFYEAKTTLGITWKSGLRMMAIGLAAGLGGFAIGVAARYF